MDRIRSSFALSRRLSDLCSPKQLAASAGSTASGTGPPQFRLLEGVPKNFQIPTDGWSVYGGLSVILFSRGIPGSSNRPRRILRIPGSPPHPVSHAHRSAAELAAAVLPRPCLLNARPCQTGTSQGRRLKNCPIPPVIQPRPRHPRSHGCVRHPRKERSLWAKRKPFSQ